MAKRIQFLVPRITSWFGLFWPVSYVLILIVFWGGPAAAQNPVVPAGNSYGFTHGQLVISRDRQITAAPDRTSATHTHVGLDISAPRGSEIYSFAPGIVIKTISEPTSCNPRVAPQPEWCYLGYMVLIRHSIGFDRTYYTLYLHMESPPLVDERASVTADTQIGVVGSTGASSGTHTHFEIRFFESTLYPAWGNIYGPGIQTDGEIVTSNWLDPVSAFRRFPDGVPQVSQPPNQARPSLSIGSVAVLLLMMAGFLLIIGARRIAKKLAAFAILIAILAAFI